MSTTKRYLESLPEEQQNEILGAVPGEWEYCAYETVPQIFCKPDPDTEMIEPPTGPDDYPDYGDLEC